MNDSLRDAEKDAAIVRGLIEHENTVQNHRFSWFTSLQGLLFAALGFSWDKSKLVVFVISIAGLLVACSAFYALRLSYEAFEKIRGWSDRNLAGYLGPPLKGYEVTQAHWWRAAKWFLPERSLPAVFAVAWCAVVVYGLLHGSAGK